MNVSYKELKKYLNLNKTPKEVENAFNEIGLEVEGVKKICDVNNLIVGEIIEIKKHPDADKLNVCLVDLGHSKEQIVCGAKNARIGIKVIVAQVGAIMANGMEIKKAVLRGENSNGMLCSLSELGLKEGYMDTVETGIHELDETAIIGTDIIEYLELDDYIYDLSITPNKSDCLSYFGLTYDFAAKFKITNELPKVKELNFIQKEMQLEKTNAFYYTIIENIKITESTKEMKAFLTKHDIKPRNNIVDLANYIMLITGQPLHTYDYAKISGNLTTSFAVEETLKTLDEKDVKLSNKNLVVKADNKVIGIAGIMGSFDSAITNETTSILVESADFDAYTTRLSSSILGLRSEASSRFEKPKDPNMIKFALNYFVDLLEKTPKESYYIDNRQINETIIKFEIEDLNKIVGIEFKEKDVKQILNDLQFEFENEFKVTIPLRRPDITKFCDLVEEIVRFYGINNIPAILPTLKLETPKITKEQRLFQKIKELLVNIGLNEIYTYSLVSLKQFNNFNLHNLSSVELMAPFSENRKYLRSNLTSSLIEVLNANNDAKNKNVNLFEIGRVYTKKEDYVESYHLGFILSQNLYSSTWNENKIEIDFYCAKGIIEKIFKILNIADYTFTSATIDGLHPYRSANILLNNKVIGFIGEVLEPKTKYKSYAVEIDLLDICTNYTKDVLYNPISKFPSIEKDMAFIIEQDLEVGKIVEFIKNQKNELLKNVSIFDVFILENSKKSVAINLEYNDTTKTLTNEVVNELFLSLAKKIENEFDCQLRDN